MTLGSGYLGQDWPRNLAVYCARSSFWMMTSQGLWVTTISFLFLIPYISSIALLALQPLPVAEVIVNPQNTTGYKNIQEKPLK